MNMVNELLLLKKQSAEHRKNLRTEEATKTALVLPFLRALGYDVFNPAELIPEYVADFGIKKGEKVDYAICSGGKLNILVECKPVTVTLDARHASQLFRYFAVTEARLAILTNGIAYQFYSDIEQPNRMDARPFYAFSIDAMNGSDPAILEAFSKTGFDIDRIVETASLLKLQSRLGIEWEALDRLRHGPPPNGKRSCCAPRSVGFVRDGRRLRRVRMQQAAAGMLAMEQAG